MRSYESPEAPPQSVRLAAQQGIGLVNAGFGGKGLKPETVEQAKTLVRGEAITFQQSKVLRAWFARFTKNRPFLRSLHASPTSPARVTWLLHGGDFGEAWAQAAYDYLIPLH